MWRRVQMSAAGPAPSRGAEEGSASKAEAGKAAEGSEVLVVVRRYRRRGVKLPAVDEAYVDFDFAVTARVVVGG